MIKCLFCKNNIKLPEIIHWVYAFFPLYCNTGHYLIYNRKNGQLAEGHWGPGLPGRITHVRIFQFKKNEWNVFKLADTPTSKMEIVAKQYVNQQSRKRQQLYQTRKAWLGCAIRLNIIKDVRILIACYLNREPFNFWKK